MPKKQKENLLVSLFKWAATEKRSPLENYCTQALVWCLRNCTDFRQRFLKEIQVTGFESVECEINSQVTAQRKFWDIEIRSTQVLQPIVIECKCSAPSEDTQLEEYHRILRERHRRFFLVSLTKTRRKDRADLLHHQLTWSDVVKMLSESQKATVEEGYVLDCFAEFLKEKGMIIPQIQSLPEFSESTACQSIQLWHDLDCLFQFFRGQEFLADLPLKFSKPESNHSQTSSWYGCYSKNQKVYVGVGFSHVQSKLKVFAWIEFNLPSPEPTLSNGLSPDLKLAQELALEWTNIDAEHEGWSEELHRQTHSVFRFAQPLIPDLNGNAMALVDWINSVLREFGSLCPIQFRDQL